MPDRVEGMVPAGRVGIVPIGDYIHGTQYERLDAVRYKGSVYLAKLDNVAEYPSEGKDNDFWMFMVQDGSIVGVKGEAEKEYRRDPFISLSAKDIGAVSKQGDTVEGPLVISENLVVGDSEGEHLSFTPDGIDGNGPLYLNQDVIIPALDELKVLVSGVDKKIQTSTVTAEELIKLVGIKGNIQTQIDGKTSVDEIGDVWNAVAKVGSYSRVAKISGLSCYIFSVTIGQSNQAISYSFLIGIGSGSAYITQIGSSGYANNSSISIRLTKAENNNACYIEVLNNYGYSGATDINCRCHLILIGDNGDANRVPYISYTPTESNVEIRASIDTQRDAVVSKIFKGDLTGTADKATNATKADNSTKWGGYSVSYLTETAYKNLNPPDTNTIYLVPKS